MRAVLLFALAGSGLAGCMTDTVGGVGTRTQAMAPLATTAGAPVGTANLIQADGGVRVTAEVRGLSPGAHGLHVHTVGRCDPPDFTTAGPHWNPTQQVHGKDAAGGPHGGDLPNIEVGADGVGTIDATLAGARLADGTQPLLDSDGATIVIHAAADDYRTDPSGNSGGRIACGVIRR